MPRLVLLRHGQAAWNLEDRFAGWWDVDLTGDGVTQARAAGMLMADNGFDFDLCFTSVQTRAIRTLTLVLEAMDRAWLPVEKNWHLNERHYGALTALTKAESALRYGRDEVRNWLGDFDATMPALTDPDFDLTKDRRYAGATIPGAESLKDTTDRVLRYWTTRLAPELAAGRNVLVAAHGNPLGALVKHLSRLSRSEIAALGIPAGQPIVYELDETLEPVDRYILT